MFWRRDEAIFTLPLSLPRFTTSIEMNGSYVKKISYILSNVTRQLFVQIKIFVTYKNSINLLSAHASYIVGIKCQNCNKARHCIYITSTRVKNYYTVHPDWVFLCIGVICPCSISFCLFSEKFPALY